LTVCGANISFKEVRIMTDILAEKLLRKALDRWENEGGNLSTQQHTSTEIRLPLPPQPWSEGSQAMLADPSRFGQLAPPGENPRIRSR